MVSPTENCATSVGITGEAICFQHLETMLGPYGIWQHCLGSTPDPSHGYSIDDEARLLIVALEYIRRGIQPELCERFAKAAFAYINEAFTDDGPFHNFRDELGHWRDSHGSLDSMGRTLWALGIARSIPTPFLPARRIDALFRECARRCADVMYPRSISFSILGLAAAGIEQGLLAALAARLVGYYRSCSGIGWRWFEDSMTYCNARLPHALFATAEVFPRESAIVCTAVESLDFLLLVSRNDRGSYSPVGNEPREMGSWFTRWDTARRTFEQQPVDAGALVECCAAAYRVTSEPRFRQAAYDAFDWYLGRNENGLSMVDPQSGGVYDALTRTGLNSNMGAESILSIHLAALAISANNPPRVGW
ncbi:MAG: hypothetical protein ACLQVD_21985 [Capsulimonadaceae bacterium]